MITWYTLLFNCNSIIESEVVSVLRPPFALELELRSYDFCGYLLFGKLPSQAQSNESLTKPDALHGLSNCKVAMVKV